jgi:SAM-dependent methyltransferase
VIRAKALEVDATSEEAELREYLGVRYDYRRLQRYEEQLEREYAACDEEGRFYRTSVGYLYDLTAFAMTRTKLPYLRELTRLTPPPSRILDYGCGIGSDGLVLLEAGYRVEFADFDNPSTRYLRWRLRRRGFEAPIHDLDQHVPAGFDAAYAFDVIEHAPDPFALLGEMELRARLVLVNLLAPAPDDSELHHELPIRDLLLHAADRGLVSYRIHHGRSHLVAYRPDREGWWSRVGGRARLASGILRELLRGRLARTYSASSPVPASRSSGGSDPAGPK